MVLVNCKCGNVMEVVGMTSGKEGKYVGKSIVTCTKCREKIITDFSEK